MTLDGIILNEEVIYDLRKTTYAGMTLHIAELDTDPERPDSEETRTRYVPQPAKYHYVGMDEHFRRRYERK